MKPQPTRVAFVASPKRPPQPFPTFHEGREIDPGPGPGGKRRYRISLRTCNILFFLTFILTTAAAIAIAVFIFSSKAIRDLQQTSSATFTTLQDTTNSIVTELSNKTNALLDDSVDRAANATTTAFSVSQDQVMQLGSQLLSNELMRFHAKVLEAMNSITFATQITGKYIQDYQLNVSKFEDMLLICRQIFSSLRFESSMGVDVVDAINGFSINLIDRSRSNRSSFASIRNGTTGLMSVYGVNMKTSEIDYPNSRCVPIPSMCDVPTMDPRLAEDFKFVSTLQSQEIAWGPIGLLQYPTAWYKYMTIFLTIRDEKSQVVLGSVGRSLTLNVLDSTLASLVASTPEKRMYVVDLTGSILASSHIDPAANANMRPFENATDFPELVINQSAQKLLQLYGQWSSVPTAVDDGTLDILTLRNQTSGQSVEYYIQVASIPVLNLHWLAVVVTPVRMYLGRILDMKANLSVQLGVQAARLRSEHLEAKATIQEQVHHSWALIENEIDDSRRHSDESFRYGIFTSVGITIGVVVAAAILAILFNMAITAPLHALAAKIEQLANMDLDGIDMGDDLSWFAEIAYMQACFCRTVANMVELKQYIPDTLFAPMDDSASDRGGGSVAGPSSTGIPGGSFISNRQPTNSGNINNNVTAGARASLYAAPCITTTTIGDSGGTGEGGGVITERNSRNSRSTGTLSRHSTKNIAEKLAAALAERLPSSEDAGAGNNSPPHVPNGSGAGAMTGGGGGGLSPNYQTTGGSSPLGTAIQMPTARRSRRTLYLASMGMSSSVVTLLIVDVHGFNTLMMTRSIQEIINTFTLYLGLVVKAVKDQNGVVDRCYGDKVFCHWNASIGQANHQSKGCMTAFAILEGLPIAGFLTARIALASGTVLCGNLGAENIKSFHILGNLVNQLFFLGKHAGLLGADIVSDMNTAIQVKHLATVRLIDVVPQSALSFASAICGTPMANSTPATANPPTLSLNNANTNPIASSSAPPMVGDPPGTHSMANAEVNFPISPGDSKLKVFQLQLKKEGRMDEWMYELIQGGRAETDEAEFQAIMNLYLQDKAVETIAALNSYVNRCGPTSDPVAAKILKVLMRRHNITSPPVIPIVTTTTSSLPFPRITSSAATTGPAIASCTSPDF